MAIGWPKGVEVIQPRVRVQLHDVDQNPCFSGDLESRFLTLPDN